MKRAILSLLIVPAIIYSQTQYRFFINNINLPINNFGVLGDVNIPPEGGSGRFDSVSFLFSGGFWLSGYNQDTLWANGEASASRIHNYIAGNVDSNQYDPRYDLYVIENSNYINYTDWNRYKFAVNNGAEYYDGDGNGIYDPIDLNGNYRWDPNEDKPDILSLGSQTAWCIYNDGVETRERFVNVNPQGIEIHQSVFGFSDYTAPQLQNVVFIRYKIINTGKANSILDSVYFTAWADADLGNYADDLVGSDTLTNSGYIYNDSTDYLFGDNPPAFFISILQGPKAYIPGETFIDINSNGMYDEGIDTPIDTAYNRKGNELGIEKFLGAKNLGMTSFTNYMSSNPTNGDPNDEIEARNYMTGKFPNGEAFNPCDLTQWGGVFGGVDCSLINPFYWYSGDPVTNIGWLNTRGFDQRMNVNSGPFNMEVGKPITIIYAYIIGRGTDRLNSITKAREIAEFTHQFYQSNFDDNLVSVDEETTTLLTEFILYQNFPNPFNPSTTIQYAIGSRQFVSLKVYDVLGNEVATLIDEFRNAGSYHIEFNASQFASGIYFYQLNTGDFTQTKKMILLK